MSDLVKLYNPANAGSLTEGQISDLQNLTSDQIKELAHAYPNSTMQRAYLLIIDGKKPAEKQLPSLSSFENLWNLREKNGQRSWVAFNFKGHYKTNGTKAIRPRKTEVFDLTDFEMKTLPGFKVASNIEAEDKKVPVKQIQK